MSGNFAIKGGGVGRLMANAILNFHFDYLNPSLRKNALVRSYTYWITGAEERDHGGGGPVREAERGQRGARHPQHCLQEAGG